VLQRERERERERENECVSEIEKERIRDGLFGLPSFFSYL
jgi:hypothetical protein